MKNSPKIKTSQCLICGQNKLEKKVVISFRDMRLKEEFSSVLKAQDYADKNQKTPCFIKNIDMCHNCSTEITTREIYYPGTIVI